ncbi:MAG: hypothetical protein VYA30_16560 [Myxococcota bacterium]|nr:hypothetical protein [Myxococcota bacterium]
MGKLYRPATLILFALLVCHSMVYGAPVEQAEFVEDRKTPGAWTFQFHGYARLPVRFMDKPGGDQGPDLVDDNYGQSGFAYLRINETEWVEMTLSAVKGNTRVVSGVMANNLSDWSDRSGSSSTPAFAFVEHDSQLTKDIELTTRVGMFWRRLGYLDAYDTYLIGRTHLAGAMLQLKAFDLIDIEAGLGAHDRNPREAFGFGPTNWFRAGITHLGSNVNGYFLKTTNEDNDPSKSYTKTGDLAVIGFDANLVLKHFGRLEYIFSFIKANNAEFIGRGVELLHSLDGKNLKLNFLGSEQNGTGEIQNQGLDATWVLSDTLDAFGSGSPAWLKGLELGLSGMLSWVATPHEQADVGDPGKNDRLYYKWGTDLRYKPLWLAKGRALFACRYDRVVTHADQDSLSFRAISPRLGWMLNDGVTAFVQYSKYSYGDNVTAAYFSELAEKATRSGNANLGETTPTDNVFKIQVQASW